MATATTLAIDWTEQGFVPDSVIRHGIRRLLKQRLAQLPLSDCESQASAELDLVQRMDASEIAYRPNKANEQHYEVDPEFFRLVLGEFCKYSCCYWPEPVQTLPEAEAAALRETCYRADLQDGMDVLDLGCGWGSLSLWAAAHYPNSTFTAVSNSRSQGDYIVAEARRRGLPNVAVITQDMNRLEMAQPFDRVISIEMFEHMRNYRQLFERIHGWLKPGGCFFLHIFCHKNVPYEFVDKGPGDWMSRHFFTGGIMPSDNLPLYFQNHLKLSKRWRWNGKHYTRTLNAWLANMDFHKPEILPLFLHIYGDTHAEIWWMRWRIFFMACAELFAYDDGQQWWVSHYLFERPA